nr:MAG TPA: hypothetical protein [Caudoviricetes sp.]
MIHQPKHPVSDDSSQHIGQDIIDLKITSAGNELESLHSQAGHKSRKDVPEKSPKPGKCPGACKAIRDEKQHVFHHEGVISRIDPPGGEKLQIHGTVPAAILSGEKSDHQYDHEVQRKHHETCHRKGFFSLPLPPGIHCIQDQSHDGTGHHTIGQILYGTVQIPYYIFPNHSFFILYLSLKIPVLHLVSVPAGRRLVP